MVISFGVSWPMNVIKAYKGATAKGTSFFFLACIELGYISSILWKIVAGDMQQFFRGNMEKYPCFFYSLNTVMVLAAIIVYFRNRKIDKKAE